MQLKLPDHQGVKTTRATITAKNSGAAALAARAASAKSRSIHLNGSV
jgi:hypothetical protein